MILLFVCTYDTLVEICVNAPCVGLSLDPGYEAILAHTPFHHYDNPSSSPSGNLQYTYLIWLVGNGQEIII